MLHSPFDTSYLRDKYEKKLCYRTGLSYGVLDENLHFCYWLHVIIADFVIWGIVILLPSIMKPKPLTWIFFNPIT